MLRTNRNPTGLALVLVTVLMATSSTASAGSETHSETVLNKSGCSPATVWANYTSGSDDFSTAVGSVPSNNSVSVRNSPYRYIAARGVRVYYAGGWAFMSSNCLSGGTSN